MFRHGGDLLGTLCRSGNGVPVEKHMAGSKSELDQNMAARNRALIKGLREDTNSDVSFKKAQNDTKLGRMLEPQAVWEHLRLRISLRVHKPHGSPGPFPCSVPTTPSEQMAPPTQARRAPNTAQQSWSVATGGPELGAPLSVRGSPSIPQP
jgi:hypothetical protein